MTGGCRAVRAPHALWPPRAPSANAPRMTPSTIPPAMPSAMAPAIRTAADLARRFALMRPDDRVTGDHALNPGHAAEFEGMARRAAAVLVPVMDRPEAAGGATVLLTRRADTLSKHAGQIAFPGGAVDDGETTVEAALREADEEVGLTAAHVRAVLGTLPRYASGSGFLVTPVIAVIDPAFVARPAPAEVAEVFEVPLAALMDPANHRIGEATWRGKVRRYYEMTHNTSGHRVWGVTAGIIRVMHDRLYAGEPA